MEVLPSLTSAQHYFVQSLLWGAAAIFAASFLAFLVGAQRVHHRFRLATVLSALIAGIAAYHYFRLGGSWEAAYTMSGGAAVPSGASFNDAYRYADWSFTVPLLLVQWTLLLKLRRARQTPLLARLIVAALLMIGLGYVGDQYAARSLWSARAAWGLLASLPFAYVLYALWLETSADLRAQPALAAYWLRAARWTLLISWGFYPVAYVLPMILPGLEPSTELAIQSSYTAADLLSKVGYGALMYAACRSQPHRS